MPRFIDGDPDSKHGYWKQTAPDKAVEYIMNSPLESETERDGRSQWYWIRLPNGDLVLATYPQGDTYFSTEQWRSI